MFEVDLLGGELGRADGHRATTASDRETAASSARLASWLKFTSWQNSNGLCVPLQISPRRYLHHIGLFLFS